MFKNVNKVTKMTINYGEKVNLSASWNGTFVWSNGVKNQRTISFVPAQSATYTVSDSLGFLSDKFEVTVNPPPQIVTSIVPNTSICVGKTLNFNVTLTNTTFDKWTYAIELSDKTGDFTKPTKLAGTVGVTATVQLPDTLSESSRYRLRVRPNSDLFIENPSVSFTVNRVAEVTFLNELTNPFTPSFTLRIQAKGTLPATLKVSNLIEQKITQLLTDIKATLLTGTSFKIESVTNICGLGTSGGNTIMVANPLAAEPTLGQPYSVYPNPANEVLTIKNLYGNAVTTQVILQDISGKKVKDLHRNFNESEVLIISDLPRGVYLLILRNKQGEWSTKVVKE
jgi:phosphotransferase system HPr-like phosphotransfer protein